MLIKLLLLHLLASVWIMILAKRKHHHSIRWLLLSLAVSPPLSLLLLHLLPSADPSPDALPKSGSLQQRCPECRIPVSLAATRCPYCEISLKPVSHIHNP